MVTIINYKERTNSEGDSFFVLEIQGGIEMVQSAETGRFYATAKRANVTSTFDENTCQALVGTQMPGRIIKEQCEPYDYVIKETGEEVTLYHRWVYAPENTPAQKQEPKELIETLGFGASQFSKNGQLEHA